jgi:NodT family efflux transporter outer membrane factor (OMF) lipoprotein
VNSKSVCAISAACLCAACALEAVQPAPPQLPAAFEQPSSPAASQPDGAWFRDFTSDELDSLIALAQKNSLDIASGVARVREADARARQAGAAILPQIDAAAGATQFAGESGGTTAHEIDWSALLSASYEVDFWGKNRAARDSAKAVAAASRADLAALKITIFSGVASTYFQVLSLRERLMLARLNLDAARSVLRVVQARYDAGKVSPAELASQRAAVAESELLIPQLQQQEAAARGALALLVGHAPEGFTVNAQALGALTEPRLAPGLPSELLRRRPDLIAAESNLRAAHADLAAAHAALFPSLSLTAGGGVQNPAVQAAVITLQGTGLSFTAGADLLQTIFDGGRRRAVVEEATARQQELVDDYHRSILAALLDVENALAAVHYLEMQGPSEQDGVLQNERAFEGSRLRYREGAGEYLAVLESQRALCAARDRLSQYTLARLQAAIALSAALGGGWPDAALGDSSTASAAAGAGHP